MVAPNDVDVGSPASADRDGAGAGTVSVRKLAANRANAGRSTGPWTPGGKQASRMNALRHGLTAKSLLPDEDPAEFAEFSRRMREDLRPKGPLQELLVGRAIGLSWKLLRVPAAEGEFWRRCRNQKESPLYIEYCQKFGLPLPPPRPERTGAGLMLDGVKWNDGKDTSLLRLQAYEQRVERSLMATLRQLERLQKENGRGDGGEGEDEGMDGWQSASADMKAGDAAAAVLVAHGSGDSPGHSPDGLGTAAGIGLAPGLQNEPTAPSAVEPPAPPQRDAKSRVQARSDSTVVPNEPTDVVDERPPALPEQPGRDARDQYTARVREQVAAPLRNEPTVLCAEPVRAAGGG